MRIAFDALRPGAGGDAPMSHPVAGTPTGALDFAAVMDARGSLGLSRSTAGAATRFDEGPMFGQAIAAPRSFVPGRPDVRPVERDAPDFRRPQPPALENAAPSKVRGLRGFSSTPNSAATDAVEPRDSRAATMPAAVATGIAALPPRERDVPAMVATVAGRGADRGGRARLVDDLEPVHVVMRATEGGVQVVARVGGIAADGGAAVARALDEIVSADGRRLVSLRLNGRDGGLRGGEQDHG